MKNILFVCSANKDRSRTAEDYFSEKYPDIQFDSAGTNKTICQKLGTNYINEEQLEWADEVFVMETKHLKAIQNIYGNKYFNKINVLNINDIYQYGAKDLIEILASKVVF